MFQIHGTINDAIAYFLKKGWQVVERHGKKGNRDEWIILQDKKGKWALFSFICGRDIDGNEKVLISFEKEINNQGVLF